MHEHLCALGRLDLSEYVRQFFKNIMFLFFILHLDSANRIHVIRTVHHLFEVLLLLMKVIGLRVDMSRATVLLLYL